MTGERRRVQSMNGCEMAMDPSRGLGCEHLGRPVHPSARACMLAALVDCRCLLQPVLLSLCLSSLGSDSDACIQRRLAAGSLASPRLASPPPANVTHIGSAPLLHSSPSLISAANEESTVAHMTPRRRRQHEVARSLSAESNALLHMQTARQPVSWTAVLCPGAQPC